MHTSPLYSDTLLTHCRLFFFFSNCRSVLRSPGRQPRAQDVGERMEMGVVGKGGGLSSLPKAVREGSCMDPRTLRPIYRISVVANVTIPRTGVSFSVLLGHTTQLGSRRRVHPAFTPKRTLAWNKEKIGTGKLGGAGILLHTDGWRTNGSSRPPAPTSMLTKSLPLLFLNDGLGILPLAIVSASLRLAF